MTQPEVAPQPAVVDDVAAQNIQEALAEARKRALEDPARVEAHGPQDGDWLGQAGDMLWGEHGVSSAGDVEQAPTGGAASGTPEAGGTPGAGAQGKAAELIQAAMTQLGVKYVYGAAQWGQALDCSSLIQLAYKQIGVDIPRVTYDQVKGGVAVQGGLQNAVPGDLVFTTGDIGMRANGHVGLYLGNGKVLAAPHSGTVVQIQDWSNRPLTAIRRYI
jgi:cell wall-associated NlpC family hydrolase